MLNDNDIKDFLRSSLLKYKLHGVLLVGSRARGYATEESDVDLMAFYDTGNTLISKSLYSAVYKGVEITLEHHDINSFTDDVLDFRFNIASLRMLLKVRDGVVLEADNSLKYLLEIAHMARLDDSILLQSLYLFTKEWENIRKYNSSHRRHELIKWAEILLTFDILTKSRSVAYSKPKWLYKNLNDLGNISGIELLNSLYIPTDEHIKNMFEGVEQIVNNYPVNKLPEDNQGFFNVNINDVTTILKHKPHEACPAIRFLIYAYYKIIYNDDPLNNLLTLQPFYDSSFEKIFELQPPYGYNEKVALELFISYVEELAKKTCKNMKIKWTADVGSKRFVSYFLASYNITEILPYSQKMLRLLPGNRHDEIEDWLINVEQWCNKMDLLS